MLSTEEKAYAFALDGVSNDYVYYRTISLFTGTFGPQHRRDCRKPDPVFVRNFERVMHLLQIEFQRVGDEATLQMWWGKGGWALLPVPFLDRFLSVLSRPCICLKSPLGLFWDEDIPRGRACGHRSGQKIRKTVLERDGHRCIECLRPASREVRLTMGHVIPHSRGGETTEGNLVSLCTCCNQSYADEYHPHLFMLAGLHYGWDQQLLNSRLASNPEAKAYALMLSQNIMASRLARSLLAPCQEERSI